MYSRRLTIVLKDFLDETTQEMNIFENLRFNVTTKSTFNVDKSTSSIPPAILVTSDGLSFVLYLQ